MLRESYVLVYKLVVMGLIAVEYIRLGRTGVNAYLISIKLLDLEHRLGLALSTI